MVALRGIHNETLRGHPLKALGPSLAGLTRLRSLLVSDPHLELRTANAILGCMGGLAQLEDLVMPEARVGGRKTKCFHDMQSTTEIWWRRFPGGVHARGRFFQQGPRRPVRPLHWP